MRQPHLLAVGLAAALLASLSRAAATIGSDDTMRSMTVSAAWRQRV